MTPPFTRKRRRLFVAGALASMVPAWSAWAASYPVSRPVTIVVPFGAGSVTDMTTRLLAQQLGNAFQLSFIVVNKPGANGVIGSGFVARSRPDGLTLLLGTNTTHSVIKSLMTNVPYDPQRDFTPVSRFAELMSMIVVDPRVPVTTIQQFIQLARTKPSGVRYGYGNSSGQIAGETLKHQLGVHLIAVPYRSNPQAMTDVIGGQIESMVVDVATGLSQVKAGKLRALAMLSAKRSASLPNVPTLNETVAPGFDVSAWAGIFAPAGTPAVFVDALATQIKAFDLREDIRERLTASGVEPYFAGPQAFNVFLKEEAVRWTSLANKAGIVPA